MTDLKQPRRERTEHLAIIGSGPAGLTAAIYAQRAGLSPLLIAGAFPLVPGGQLTGTSIIENFPGFPEGIPGPELVDGMRRQAIRLGARIEEDSASGIDVSSRPFRITLDGGDEVLADAVILATGAVPRRLEVPGEEKYAGRGVSYCATCDGFLFRKKRVAVVGGGDTAMEEADYLSRLASSVTLIHRRDAFRASRAMEERIRANPAISLVLSAEVQEVKGDGRRMSAVVLKDVRSGALSELPMDGLFVAAGRIPASSLVRGLAELDGAGHVAVAPGSSATSVPGLFAAGDVCDPIYRQAIVAAASGCRAALDAKRFLDAHVPKAP